MGYSDIFVKMGYVMLFAQAFPLAPFLSILTNFLELKSTMNNLATYSKRFQALPATGVGSWLQIGEVSFFSNLNLFSLDAGIGLSCS